MEPISVEEILKATDGELVKGEASGVITGVSTDSRTIKPGELFVSLIGDRFDGHDFIPQAAEKGAKAVLVQRVLDRLPEGISAIKVDNTLVGLQRLAGYYRRKFNIPVIAVTGSTGKTTTKDMIHCVLSTRYDVLKTEGNLNNEIGLPLTLFRLERHHEIAVVEMGMSGFGEIHRMVEAALPCIGVITNIGVSHIEKLGSRENILRAKLEIFDYFPGNGVAVLNGDDDMLWGVREKLKFGVKFFGMREGLDFRAEGITTGHYGVSFKLVAGGEAYPFKLPLPGRHNVYNSLAAIAVGRLFGISVGEMGKAFKAFKPGNMRLNIFETQEGTIVIDDAYNASPDSMKAALSVLKDMPGVRRIAVLGDMLELGDYAEEGHRQVGSAVVQNRVDLLITRGENSRFIGMEAQASGMPPSSIYHCQCNKDIINLLSTIVQRGDTILVKGSRGMKMEEVVSYLLKGGYRPWNH
ncbi:UDP-N-acetylmuramoyl-tripeptide--D-alanyl-D-alanine ligase [Caldicoprobacter guelmensis]|uniref:UDP-N-acetylmuramoyl-tripeptide--D-alanyl-D- alanine ligase n=1 Tax=Caldicoprobacter guelmensis TaxID=1170224 RepID=UPI00195D9401|nr:UDP-N-acetylmuramoyl-tripeptide--D-alanyl-D-alanine ligase [Caldicoprobacter guelmensis]MBM7583308.1 UDP-N-acetylmuramoyl-tripeptide--D-alanyl-D-alanine ligase [Caldicoprobacter guelmensis]